MRKDSGFPRTVDRAPFGQRRGKRDLTEQKEEQILPVAGETEAGHAGERSARDSQLGGDEYRSGGAKDLYETQIGQRAKRVPGRTVFSSSRIILATFVVLLVVWSLSVYIRSVNLPPGDYGDEGAYLQHACWLAERGGPRAFLTTCATGEFPSLHSHPLAMVAASSVAQRSLSALLPMRMTKIALAIVAAILTFVFAWRVLGPHGALALVASLLLSRNWFTKAAVVTSEPVTYALIFWAWALVAGLLRPRLRWLWAGVAFGLAFLSKGTALILLFALPPAWLLLLISSRVWRRRFVRRLGDWRTLLIRCILPFMLGASLGGGPLFVRNVVRFGNPLHNANSALMWTDNWSDIIYLQRGERLEQFTPWYYLTHTSPGRIAQRLVFGVKKQTPRLLCSLFMDRSFGALLYFGSSLLSVCVMGLGLVGMLRQCKTWRGAYSLSVVGIGFLLFCWWSYMTYASRFAATFAPIIGAYAILTMYALSRRRPSLRRCVRGLGLVLGGSAVVILLVVTPWKTWRSDLRRPVASAELTYLADWFKVHVDDKGKNVFQTPYLAPRYSFGWILGGRKGHVYQIAAYEDMSAFQRDLDARSAHYIVIERDSLRERLPLLGEYFEITNDALRIRRLPAGWTLKVADPYGATDFVILERAAPSRPSPGA